MPATAGDEKLAAHEARPPTVAMPAAMTDLAFQGASASKVAQKPGAEEASEWSSSWSMDWLQPVAREGITGLRVARLQTFSEPRHALFGGAVRPALRLNRAARHFLEPVVSYG